MSKVIAWLKNIRLDRILTVFMAGLLLFVSTACSGGASAKTAGGSAKTADQLRQEVPESAITNKYEGGMNDYSDVDPRQNIKGTQTKAKGLVDKAQKENAEKSVDSTEQYVENYRSGTPLGERVKRIGENVSESAKQVTGDVTKGTQENLENVKATTQDAGKRTKQAANETADAAQSKVKEDVKNTKRAVNKAADTGENLGNKIQQAAQDASDAVKSTVNKGAKDTKRALNDAADAVD